MTTLIAPITEVPDLFRPLRREEFVALHDIGAFGDARIELVGGVLVEMAPVKPRHASGVMRLDVHVHSGPRPVGTWGSVTEVRGESSRRTPWT